MTDTTTALTLQHARACAQIRQMTIAQEGLNKQAYSTDWLAKGALPERNEDVWDYPLAAGMEIAEFLNSWGYAWWSSKEWPRTAPDDRQNCMTELVDAWHFILSQAIIEEDGDVNRSSLALLQGYSTAVSRGQGELSHRGVVNTAKTLMTWLIDYSANSGFSVLPDLYHQFFTLLLGAGFSMDHFTTRYNAKLQLNIFRQLNGYKEKPRTYEKMWAPGVEDNEFLSNFIDKSFDSSDKSTPSNGDVMRWIAATYTAQTGKVSITPPDTDDTETEEL
jgi:hypothetical protein